ncbi:MAG: UvrD-helicase domain-containing protein [Clostridia bacterium]|nr:UvrD-helicase domain-containing protein [Clostridia bacterium]
MVRIDELLEKLNDEQIKPVLQTEGAVLVLAGAGSGKTRVLTSRIAYLVEEKRVPAEAILAITFTNKAANEMKERLSQIVDVSRAWVCTIHSMCVRILRMYAQEVGITANFSIYSETERNNIIKKSFQECDYDDEKLLKTIKWHIANAKMLGLDAERYAEEYAGEYEIDDIVKVYRRYQKHLRENNALDFDDLLNETRLLLKNNADAREYLGSKFRYILVDEFQDTNAVQYEIVRLLASVHGNLFAVGDDDQSIYGWRGAKIENILHFEKDFKDAKVFKLERNYRSTKNILKLANTVIKNNGHRKDKTLWTENGEGEKAVVHEAEEESGEARYIAHTIAGLMREGYKFSDFAILMRLNALTRSFEQEFTGDGIPYKVFGGFKFFERKEIKDLLAYLRLINNPFDSEAAVRIINFPKRGIGAKTVETLQNYAYEQELSFYDALLDLDEIGFTGATKQKLVDFRDMIKTWIVDSLETPVNELVKKIVADTHMREAYADESDESINKRANIEEFINSVEEYCRLNEGATLTDYLNQVTLSSDTDDMDDGNYVTLATVHSVKGLEFKCVFVCGMEENILPVSRAVDNEDEMEEERRLMYVAITRAKERLFLTRSKSRYLYGKREPTARSRFLKELASELDLPRETRRMSFGYDDFDDPEMYGNSSYGGGRYASNDDYGRKNTYGGGGYGSSHNGGYGGYKDSARSNSGVTRTAWNGGSSYGSSSYGNSYGSSYGGSSYGGGNKQGAGAKSGGFTYGGISRTSGAAKPTGGKDVSAFRIGVRVRHPKFGDGTVVNVRGTGNNTILDIGFEGLGIKQLSASLAPLTIIG